MKVFIRRKKRVQIGSRGMVKIDTSKIEWPSVYFPFDSQLDVLKIKAWNQYVNIKYIKIKISDRITFTINNFSW